MTHRNVLHLGTKFRVVYEEGLSKRDVRERGSEDIIGASIQSYLKNISLDFCQLCETIIKLHIKSLELDFCY